jgi:dicarboxylate/amino acid:cation (Na+ or H+) symporter, DAACS family
MTSSHVSKPRGMALHTKIVLGLLIGAGAGLIANFVGLRWPTSTIAMVANLLGSKVPTTQDFITFAAANVLEPIGKVFLRLVLMVVVPLVVSALALGVLELGDVRRLGRVGLRTLGFTLILSASSVAIGLGLVNGLQPGKSLTPAQETQLKERYKSSAAEKQAAAEKGKSLKDTLLDLLPENPLQEMVGALDGSSKGNGMLAVMVFALILGIALTTTTERTGTLVRLLEGLFDVSMAVIAFAMRIAPYAVACLIFSVTAQIGFDILMTLLRFVGTVLLGLGLQMFVVYPLMLLGIARVSPRRFFVDVSAAIFTAFGTSSSNATLPTSLRIAKENLKLKPEVSQFVLTVGATANQNGTALFEGVVVLFLAQVFGVELNLPQQLTVVLMSILAGVGTAGVPGGSLPLIVILLNTVGVPGEGIAIILGVDRLLDMCRTVLNVTGDLVLATCVSAKEPGGPDRPVDELAAGASP